MSALVCVGPSRIDGQGLFASGALVESERVIQYIGERISKSESIRRCAEGNQFIFYLNEQFDLDGSTEENLARFINHHCSPNCQMEFINDKLWVTAARHIVRGEELTFDYGYDLSDYREHPCHCGAPNCARYIIAEEFRDALQA